MMKNNFKSTWGKYSGRFGQLVLLTITLFLSCSHLSTPTEKDTAGHKTLPGQLIAVWEFKGVNSEEDSGIRTSACLIIKGASIQRECIGSFYGKVMKVMKSSDKTGGLMGGDAITGFMTFMAGAGQEVMARYDERYHRIIILVRDIGEERPPGAFKALKSFHVREQGHFGPW